MAEPDLGLGSRSSADDPTDPVEAGLRAVFEEEPGEASCDSHKSIVQLLADASGTVSGISLRDVDAEVSPVHVRGRTREAPALPAQIGRYRVVGEIGRGGVGAIYRAHDVDLGRDVALKVLLDGHETIEQRQRVTAPSVVGLRGEQLDPLAPGGTHCGSKPVHASWVAFGVDVVHPPPEFGDGPMRDPEHRLGLARPGRTNDD